MSKTNKRSNRNAKARKSLKGKWGHIGAPPKAMKFPGRPFVMAALFAINKTLCELTVRKNVDKALENGTLVELMPLPQKGGAVGRPKSRFVLKSKFVASKMTIRPAKTVTSTIATVSPAPVAEVTPAPAPVVETVTEAAPVATPAPEAPIPAPEVTTLPATEVATISEIPAAPAVEAPVAPLSETPAVS
jgi:hypothetical protein